jgi:endonuclease/exonuclease/phosphatase family metal-dependent hydrolase
LSKFPFRELRRIKWNHCTGADCLTPKGFTYSRIEIAKSVYVDFYNVHANAYNEPEAAEARRQNVIQLSDYIKQHSAGNAVVVMGDLNGHYAFELDNISLLLDLHQMKDVWIAHQSGGLAPRASAAIPAKDILSISESVETIDKILYRGSAAVQLESVGYELEKEQFTNAAGLPLSDHHPISAQFVWKLKAQPELRLARNATLDKKEVQH